MSSTNERLAQLEAEHKEIEENISSLMKIREDIEKEKHELEYKKIRDENGYSDEQLKIFCEAIHKIVTMMNTTSYSTLTLVDEEPGDEYQEYSLETHDVRNENTGKYDIDPKLKYSIKIDCKYNFGCRTDKYRSVPGDISYKVTIKTKNPGISLLLNKMLTQVDHYYDYNEPQPEPMLTEWTKNRDLDYRIKLNERGITYACSVPHYCGLHE